MVFLVWAKDVSWMGPVRHLQAESKLAHRKDARYVQPSFVTLPREQFAEETWWPQENPYLFQTTARFSLVCVYSGYVQNSDTGMVAISRRKHFICRNCRWIMQLYNDEVYVLDPQSGWWERATCCACVILDPSGRPLRDDSEETCLGLAFKTRRSLYCGFIQ